VALPSLSRVGLTGVEAVLHLRVDRRPPQLFAARLACFAEPPAGLVHPARFEDLMRDAVRDVLAEDAGLRIERLAERLAERLRERLGARRAEVTIAARFPEHRPAPVSGIATRCPISPTVASAIPRSVARSRAFTMLIRSLFMIAASNPSAAAEPSNESAPTNCRPKCSVS